jgi:hypothetical protein
MRQYYEFVDLGKNEDKMIKEGITGAVEMSYMITESRRYGELQVSLRLSCVTIIDTITLKWVLTTLMFHMKLVFRHGY